MIVSLLDGKREKTEEVVAAEEPLEAVSSLFAGRRQVATEREKQALYLLRRVLVKRLQAATRGISRGARVAAHRRFVEQWGEFSRTGRLEFLSGLVPETTGPGKSAPEETDPASLAQPFGRNRQVTTPARGRGAVGPRRIHAVRCPGKEETVGDGQGDLFVSDLSKQRA